MIAAVRRALRPSGLVWKRTSTCGSPIVPRAVAISTDHVPSRGCPAEPASSSGRCQVALPGTAAPSIRGTAAPAGNSHCAPSAAVCGPGASGTGAPPSMRTVVGSVSSKRVSTSKSTVVGAVKRVNSTGFRACARTSGPTASTSHTAGTAKSSQLEGELERLDVGRRAHPAERQRHAHHDAGHDHTHPVRRAADQRQHLARRGELRHEVQVADHQHDERAQPAQDRRGEPGLGEVGDGQRARAPQRRGHQRRASAGSRR